MSFSKTPVAKLDYKIDWGTGGWMPQGDAIATAEWSTDETFLAPPIDLIASASGNGGALAANAYYWVVTALNTAGETTTSNEVTATVTGTTSSVQLGWNEVPGATGYNLYRGSNTNGTPVEIDSSATGTIGTNTSGPASSLSANCTYAKGSSANYVIAIVPYLVGLRPSLISAVYGTQSGGPNLAMSLLGTAAAGYGGLAFFGLSSPPTGTHTVTGSVQSYGDVVGMGITCASFTGWGSTVFNAAPGGQVSSPQQTVTAVYGDLVVWAAANVTGSGINAALSSFNQTQLENSGNLSLAIDDQLAFLLGYATGTTQTSFSADVAQANIDQWWSAGALTLLPADPPINTLVTTMTGEASTIYTDTGSSTATATPPASNTAITSISIADTPAPSITNTTATAWIANGTAGETYTVTCEIETAQGRIDARSLDVSVINL